MYVLCIIEVTQGWFLFFQFLGSFLFQSPLIPHLRVITRPTPKAAPPALGATSYAHSLPSVHSDPRNLLHSRSRLHPTPYIGIGIDPIIRGPLTQPTHRTHAPPKHTIYMLPVTHPSHACPASHAPLTCILHMHPTHAPLTCTFHMHPSLALLSRTQTHNPFPDLCTLTHAPQNACTPERMHPDTHAPLFLLTGRLDSRASLQIHAPHRTGYPSPAGPHSPRGAGVPGACVAGPSSYLGPGAPKTRPPPAGAAR